MRTKIEEELELKTREMEETKVEFIFLADCGTNFTLCWSFLILFVVCTAQFHNFLDFCAWKMTLSNSKSLNPIISTLIL